MLTQAKPIAIAAHALAVTRTFNAPRDLVWKAWSESDRLA